MNELKLFNSNKVALIDSEDYERLSKFKWRTYGSSNNTIATRKYGHLKEFVALASEIMHQPKVMFDHKDRNFLNNQKDNLRQATYSQNNANRTKSKGCSSKYKGVIFDKYTGKWQARLKFNNKIIHLGRFLLEEDAARAYNKTALSIFKEFANLNKDEQGNIL